MKPELQRIKIAEACGWKIAPTQASGDWKLYCGEVAISFWLNPEKDPTLSDVLHQLPDYLNCLNDMHEAEKMLNQTDYARTLNRVLGNPNTDDCYTVWSNCITATAGKRAEAFLKTIGKWDSDQ